MKHVPHDLYPKYLAERQSEPLKLASCYVRQITIKIPGKVDIQHHVDYLFTSFDHGSELPNFLDRRCLKINKNGVIQYDFGSTSRTDMNKDLVMIDEDNPMTTVRRAKLNKHRNKVTIQK
ncbi:hypothetical protein DPMN_099301 [Dreissena polymorpha]|uniref:Uncharacterized protein n=1 Tax=Dreissena polymorpha TaxID=45954 RepID=A0A9D4R746_DREPO|nr:hypothetical protein DPMN_099301 [Dreissena polymorpha]